MGAFTTTYRSLVLLVLGRRGRNLSEKIFLPIQKKITKGEFLSEEGFLSGKVNIFQNRRID